MGTKRLNEKYEAVDIPRELLQSERKPELPYLKLASGWRDLAAPVHQGGCWRCR